ncbi:hypothetical protein L6452_28773 [Arctium lappa]|uniref:Uncharacterized protein n=1 Tax=Arctium lappa TaxID=4217 RepID=A0ACB8ZYG7_ARCLA|nr:hypothetical protein L6452_28773 [Arctium lappa]
MTSPNRYSCANGSTMRKNGCFEMLPVSAWQVIRCLFCSLVFHGSPKNIWLGDRQMWLLVTVQNHPSSWISRTTHVSILEELHRNRTGVSNMFLWLGSNDFNNKHMFSILRFSMIFL